MPKLPQTLLERRLDNEEEEVSSKGYSFKSTPVWADVGIPSVAGQENVPVARRYDVRLTAKGYSRQDKHTDPAPSSEHQAQVFILRAYPYPTDKSRLGAPFRVIWVSSIFHPNIAQGTSAGGSGIVCWDLLKTWAKLDTLYGIVKGLELLIEHPNTKSPLNLPDCIAAAKWFESRKSQQQTN
jgi:hypothetical protein